jgi:hypothetical protein
VGLTELTELRIMDRVAARSAKEPPMEFARRMVTDVMRDHPADKKQQIDSHHEMYRRLPLLSSVD